MLKPIKDFQNIEQGSVVILGNGPSLDNYRGKTFDCPTIGINLSYLVQPHDYYVTVAYDRLAEIASEKITAKVIFSCIQKEHAVPKTIPQPIAWVDMSLPDLYSNQAGKVVLFDPDISKPTHATFGGIFAIQVAIFLGFKTIFLVGFDGGGLTHFSDYPVKHGYIPVEHHVRCFWHVNAWLKAQQEVEIFQTNPEAAITFPIAAAPIKEN